MHPLIVTSDLHFAADASASTVRDLAGLLRDHPSHEFVLAGDVFNLSWEAPGQSAEAAVLALLSGYPELANALRQHVSGGGPLTLIAGNHDAGIMGGALREALLHKLELTSNAPLEISPWFVRRAGVHIEHG